MYVYIYIYIYRWNLSETIVKALASTLVYEYRAAVARNKLPKI